jgi:hypothetical protein
MLNKLLALTLLASACTASTNDPTSGHVTSDPAPSSTTEMKPIATFTSMTGSTIEIYAVGAHGYFATELADVGMDHVLSGTTAEARQLPSQLYRSLTGKTDAPSSLVALDSQIVPVGVEVVALSTGGTSLPPPSKPVAAAGNCTATFFQKNDCPNDTGGGDTFDWCLLNHTGGAFANASTVDLSFSNLCSTHGQVLWQIQNGDGGSHLVTVLEGQFFSYSLHDSDETWLHYTVLEASGDTFQFGGDFLWY